MSSANVEAKRRDGVYARGRIILVSKILPESYLTTLGFLKLVVNGCSLFFVVL